MARTNTRIQNLTKVTTLDDDDVLPTGPASGDVAKGITWLNLRSLIEVGDIETIIEISTSTTQLITHDYVSCTGPLTYTLISASTAVKGLTIKSELGGGDVTITPNGTETIEGATGDRVITAGTGITITPITGGWSES